MTGKTNDYSELKPGDVFEIDGVPDKLFTVQSKCYSPGGGAGMGEYPPTWKIATDQGQFTYDPWARHLFRKFVVVDKAEVLPTKLLKDVFHD